MGLSLSLSLMEFTGRSSRITLCTLAAEICMNEVAQKLLHFWKVFTAFVSGTI